jgi:hypothetical protein
LKSPTYVWLINAIVSDTLIGRAVTENDA